MDYFTADTHYFHGNILKYCKRLDFMSDREKDIILYGSKADINKLKISGDSILKMNHAISSTINRLVQPNDRLFILGDLLFPFKNIEPQTVKEYYQRCRDTINCRNVIMVWGNHDPPVGSKSRSLASQVFDKNYDKITIKTNGQKIQLNHEAMAIWDCRHHGAWHLYGHSHSMAEESLEEMMPGRFSMDVGIDNAYKLFGEYRPFSFNEIKNIMKNKSGFGLLTARD